MKRGALFVLLALGGALADRLEDTLYIPLDHPAIQYSEQTSNDPVARLDKKLERGEVKLEFAPNEWGYLPAVLKELGIPIDSQALVFSRTSTEVSRISPRTPRAIYFSDDAAVGYVQAGDVLELAALDPVRGVYLYTLDSAKSTRPRFARREDCLKCHQGPITLGVPGLVVSSVHPRTGPSEAHGSAFMTDQRTSFNERWGGWYVTGTHGSQTHLGNNPALADPLRPGGLAGNESQNVTSLEELFDTSRYPASTSDLVALMTLEHQSRMTNLITRVGWDARIAQRDGKLDAVRAQLDAEIAEMATYMLFADETPLKEPVAGVSTFTKTFAQRGPRDSQGRSLRDFDLKTRLFRYPLSYMIYSAAFDAMPDIVKDKVYQRLYDVLSGKDQGEIFARLSPADRVAILAIVRNTKPNLPAYWGK